jgi:hypothetical protein
MKNKTDNKYFRKKNKSERKVLLEIWRNLGGGGNNPN